MKRKSSIFFLMTLFYFFRFVFIQNSLSDEEIPAWLKRIEFTSQVETDKKPMFYFQMVQPLYQNTEKTDAVFIQPRVSAREERSIYNIGFGYRRLTHEELILGMNVFGDYQDLHQHGRAGAGVEALGQILEVRMNTYFAGITPKRIIEDLPASKTLERVVDGLDLELGAPIPYLPWLKIFGSGMWHDFKTFDDQYGWKSRLEARINDGLRLEFYTWDDNKGDMEFGGRIRCTFAFSGISDFKDVFKFSKEAFPKKDLKEDLLIPVERNFNIVVEKWNEANGLIVEAGRS